LALAVIRRLPLRISVSLQVEAAISIQAGRSRFPNHCATAVCLAAARLFAMDATVLTQDADPLRERRAARLGILGMSLSM
jgi:hypothetical protein